MKSRSIEKVITSLIAFICSIIIYKTNNSNSTNSSQDNQEYDLVTTTTSLSFDTIERRKEDPFSSERNLASVPIALLWKNDLREDGNFWITVRIGTGFSGSSEKIIINALQNLEERSKVIKFDIVKFRPNNVAYLHLLSTDGCSSRLGRVDLSKTIHGQSITLGGQSCMNSASIQHEMMHALGFGHEHQRLDRDKYIRVIWDNIVPSKKNMFQKISEVNSLGTPYDFESIMHYSPYDWSKNGQRTMIPRDSSKTIASGNVASSIDILQIRLMYQCQNEARNYYQYLSSPCSRNCQCWENMIGCQNEDLFCKGDLVCVSNKCQKPNTISVGNPDSTKRQLVKDRIEGKRYYVVPGVMFDIQAKASPIVVTNLIFKGLGLPNQPENVEVDVFTKQWTHTSRYNKPSQWTHIGSTILKDNGSDSAQLFPTKYFPLTKINPWNRHAIYIQVKNCANCNKLRAWEGSNYSLKKNPFVEDNHAKILEGCILPARFNNMWQTCKDQPGGTSYTFWGGFEYTLA